MTKLTNRSQGVSNVEKLLLANALDVFEIYFLENTQEMKENKAGRRAET
jgi:hypothetical protein